MTRPGACIELRKRAHEERAAAAIASSAKARRAHLELSFRLEKVADERRSGSFPAEHREAPFVDLRVELGKAIERAFPLPKSGSFEGLLKAIDSAEERLGNTRI